jgi:hypothetical protein
LIAAKKEVGKKRWPEFRKTQCHEMSEHTLREWERWAKPDNKKKIPPEIWQRVAKSEKGVVRAVREILKTERTQAQKDGDAARKANNAKTKSKAVLEELSVPSMFTGLSRFSGRSLTRTSLLRLVMNS